MNFMRAFPTHSERVGCHVKEPSCQDTTVQVICSKCWLSEASALDLNSWTVGNDSHTYNLTLLLWIWRLSVLQRLFSGLWIMAVDTAQNLDHPRFVDPWKLWHCASSAWGSGKSKCASTRDHINACNWRSKGKADQFCKTDKCMGWKSHQMGHSHTPLEFWFLHSNGHKGCLKWKNFYVF